MRAESNKYFQFGFVLTESELRRVLGTAEEQFKKLSGGSSISHHFELKFRNGAVATTSSLDDVVSQENIGSSQITALKIKLETIAASDKEHEQNSIAVEFI